MLPFDVLVISDPSVEALEDRLASVVRAAPRGRVAISIRDHAGGAASVARLARAIAPAAAAHGVTLLVHDRADVAALVRAGVHLPERGLDAQDARAVLGPRAIVGASCPDAAGLSRRASEGCDYVVLGPFVSVPGKNAPLGAAAFAAMRATVSIPVLALGGVGPRNAASARAAGAAGVAAVRSVLAADDPATALRALLAAWDG